MGMEMVVAEVDVPPPPHWEASVVYAKPGKGGNDNSKSDAQKKGERAVWSEATKGLKEPQKTRLHNLLVGQRVGARNLDPQEIIALRETEFPENPYPGGWLDKFLK